MGVTYTATQSILGLFKLEVDFVKAWYSLEQFIGMKADKLASTTVDFIRSEWNLETKHLYCLASLRCAKTVKTCY